MAYIDETYYNQTFKGKSIPHEEFDRIADIASDAVYDICRVKPSGNTLQKSDFKRAVCYEAEMIYEQGGVDAILGFSAASVGSGGERLGDYSVSAPSAGSGIITARGGIPVSTLTISLLRKIGLMCRWAYAKG